MGVPGLLLIVALRPPIEERSQVEHVSHLENTLTGRRYRTNYRWGLSCADQQQTRLDPGIPYTTQPDQKGRGEPGLRLPISMPTRGRSVQTELPYDHKERGNRLRA